MTYTLTVPISLGSSKAGLTLKGRFYDTSGVASGAAFTTGFTESGGGDYEWTGSIADAFRGTLRILDNADDAYLARAAINPEEAEHADAKTSSRLAPTTAGRTLDVSAGGEAGVDWANVGSPTTVVGLSGTTVKTATDVEADTADIQSRLPAALVSGRMDSSVGAMANAVLTAAAIAADAITAAKVAADAVTEIQAGLASQASVDDLPTNAELATALAAADDAVLAAIAALNDLSAAQVNAEVDTALADYDAPTKAELDVAVAPLATAAALDVVDNLLDTEIAALITALGDVPTANENADALLDRANAIETGWTPRMALRIIAAALGGELAISGNTVTIRDIADAKTRITATTDADGQRTALTLDGS